VCQGEFNGITLWDSVCYDVFVVLGVAMGFMGSVENVTKKKNAFSFVWGLGEKKAATLLERESLPR
jgi:hypothetical protein